MIAAALGFDPDEDRVQGDPLGQPRDRRSRTARSTTTSAPTRSTTSARSRSASPARTSSPARTCWSARTTPSITGKDTSRARRSARRPARPRSSGSSDEQLTEAQQHRGVQDLLGVRRRAARQEGRRGHHRRRDPQGLRGPDPDELKVVGKPFSEEQYGIGLPQDDKALRDAINDHRSRAVTGRHLAEDLRRHARQVRLRGAPRRRSSATEPHRPSGRTDRGRP